MPTNLRDTTAQVAELVANPEKGLKGARKKKYQIMDIAPMDKAALPVEMQLDVDDLTVEYTDRPVFGATTDFSDGQIMQAIEPYGDDLNYTLKSAAKALNVPFMKFMYRVLGTQVLVNYLKIVRKIRAQTLLEERDRLYRKMEEDAVTKEGLKKMLYLVYSGKIKSIENEIQKLDRETYGNQKLSVGVKTTHSKTETSNEFVISTSLQEGGK